MNLLDSLKQFDAYPKTLEDFRIQTLSGGLLTLISAFVMILLFASEISVYRQRQISEELFVDTSKEGKLKINIDIIFQRISCSYLGIDAMDVSGEIQTDISHNIYKRRISSQDGTPITDPVRETAIGILHEKSQNVTTTLSPICGSCYGAESLKYKCCNTCYEIKEAYRLKSWAFNPSLFTLCQGDDVNSSDELPFNEGCQIYGYLEVNRVGGSFHIAPGKGFSISSVHIHDIQPYLSSDFNLSHTIRHLSFGRHIDGANINPLDNLETLSKEGSTMYQYYIKIVPTTYSRLDGSILQTNQFSVTRLSKVLSARQQESGMPGVFFTYELAPVMVKYSEKEKSFAHFATGLCAIIGGVFTVAGILDKLIYHSGNFIQDKINLGKTT